jgi:hypothetical protein
MSPHRIPDTQGGSGESIWQLCARGYAGQARGEALQRHSEGGDAAVIPGDDHLVPAQAADLGYEAEYVALERMTRITVRSRGEALVDTDGEHTGVLARAVAMDRTRLFAVADEFVGLRFVQRQMGAALQVFLGKA